MRFDMLSFERKDMKATLIEVMQQEREVKAVDAKVKQSYMLSLWGAASCIPMFLNSWPLLAGICIAVVLFGAYSNVKARKERQEALGRITETVTKLEALSPPVRKQAYTFVKSLMYDHGHGQRMCVTRKELYDFLTYLHENVRQCKTIQWQYHPSEFTCSDIVYNLVASRSAVMNTDIKRRVAFMVMYGYLLELSGHAVIDNKFDTTTAKFAYEMYKRWKRENAVWTEAEAAKVRARHNESVRHREYERQRNRTGLDSSHNRAETTQITDDLAFSMPQNAALHTAFVDTSSSDSVRRSDSDYSSYSNDSGSSSSSSSSDSSSGGCY